jgi:hypothetical protein
MTNGSKKKRKLRDREPVAVATSITNSLKTLVLALLALALAFGWVDWSDGQNAAVIGVVAAVFALMSLIVSAILRQHVTPNAHPRDPDGNPLVTARQASTVTTDVG